MIDLRAILVPVFLVSQAVLVRWVAGSKRPPQPPDLSRFPAEFGAWKKVHEDPIADDVRSEPTNSIANLFVVWFQSQRAGASQPHSPKVCLPASGWTPESTSEADPPHSRWRDYRESLCRH